MSNDSLKLPDGLCTALVICGIVLLGAGMVTLLYAAATVYQVMHNPADIPFIQILQEKVTLADMGFSGKTADGKEVAFKVTEPVRYVIFFWLSLIGLSIIVRIFNGLVVTGASLIKLGAEGREEKRPDIIA